MKILDSTIQKLGRRAMAFAVAEPDDDELLRSIEADAVANNLTLEEIPDYARLSGFWNQVENDLRSDPKWFDFARDD